jgi:hypothetical protein
MLLAEAIMRLLVAIMEAYVEELRHAKPEQIQAILDRRERDLTRADKVIDKVWPGWLP